MILIGDCRATLKQIESGSVHATITSPPYWNLRDYGYKGQIGLEKTPKEFIDELVKVFAEVHRVLRDDGTLFVNIGDSYANIGKGGNPENSAGTLLADGNGQAKYVPPGLKPKDLCGIPWRLAFALQDFGWYLRQDIIWHKPAPMPSSVKDRCTTAHEYVFLLSKKPSYYWDWYAISEKGSQATDGRLSQDVENQNGSDRQPGKTNGTMKAVGADRRNKRSVWTVNTKGYSGAHFACFPPKLIETMILAGSPDKCCASCGKGYVREIGTERNPTRPAYKTKTTGDSDIDGNRDPERHVTEYVDLGFYQACECRTDETAKSIVLDPFAGSGTTAQVAQENGRQWIMCEANTKYISMIKKRTVQTVLF